MELGRISSKQLMLLSFTLIISTGVMFLPAITGGEAKQDSWIAGLAATLLGVLLSVLYGALARRFPGQNPSEYGLCVLGPVLGRAVALLLSAFSLHTGAVVVREFGELMVTVLMPETPMLAFILCQVLVACTAARGGLEVIARVNEFWAPILLAAMLAIFALVAKDAEWGLLRPVLGAGWTPVLRGSFVPTAWMGESIILLYAAACLRRPERSTSALLAGALMAGLFLSLGAVINVAILGPEMVGRRAFPTLQVARIVEVARFITRIDSIVIILWLVGTMVKFALFLHAAAVGLAQALGLAEYTPLVLPLGALAVPIATGVAPDMPSLVAFLRGPWPLWAVSVEVAVPLLLLAAAWIRRRRGERRA